jgi:hypothetical protein
MATTQVILLTSIQSPTGLPKDRFEGVWHFLDPGGSPADVVASVAAAKLADFYQLAGAVSGQHVGHYLARSAAPTDHMTITGYDFAAGLPRPELGVATFDYGSASSTQLPEEVALCLSYYTDRNLPSKRGRSYIGPLNGAAMTGSSVPPSRPEPTFMSSLVDAGRRMRTLGPPATPPTFLTNTFPGGGAGTAAWALYSPKLGTFSAVEHGWVDDEWDGQRRRRVEASARVTL